MRDETGRPGGSRAIPGSLVAPGEAFHTDTPELYEFGPFRLDPKERKLIRGTELVALTPKVFDTLHLLVRNSGHLLEKQELVRQLWPDSFVEEGSLSNNIFVLRKALGEDPPYIETVPKRGYRFVGAVRRLSSAKTPPVLDGPTAQLSYPVHPTPDVAPRALIWRLWPTLAAVSLVVLAIGAIAWRVAQRSSTVNQNGTAIRSLVVLPLTNLSGEAEQEYFSDGLTEALTNNLGKFSALRVISRTSAMRYKNTRETVPEIARDLNVDAVIEGTALRSGNHVRITVNLIQAYPEKHLWAESYDSEVADALTVQGQLAREVAHEVQVMLTPKERNLLATPRPVNPEAQDLYFRGSYVLGQSTEETDEKAIHYFWQAIGKDPSYAEPYSALAMVYAIWMPGANSPRERMPKAREYALKALSLDRSVTDAHYALGTVALLYDWDWTAAENEFQRELELNPNHAFAHQLRARALVARGRTEEGIAEAKSSLCLSPAVAEWDNAVWVYILARRYDLARELTQKEMDLEPNFPWVHFNLAQIYEHEGRVEDGAREFLRADELLGTDTKELRKLKQAIAKDGAKGYWRRKVEDYRELAKSGYAPPVLTAMACVRIGDKQCAFEWLEKGFQERDDLMINLKAEPIFDGLQEDRRFQALVRRVGIP